MNKPIRTLSRSLIGALIVICILISCRQPNWRDKHGDRRDSIQHKNKRTFAREVIRNWNTWSTRDVERRRTNYEVGFMELQRKRQSLLREVCQRQNLGNIDDDFDVMKLEPKVKLLYSDKHRFILCEIPKCASSSMKKVLLTTEKLVNTTNPSEVKSELAHRLADAKLDLRHLQNATGIAERLRNYKRLIIVRDPVYRLLSAYRNKLEKEYPWSRDFADVSRKIHSNISVEGRGTKLATFAEFLEYAAMDTDRDRHWKLYYDLCLPCTIRYDFIAHVETINNDMTEFMKMLRMENISFPSNYAASEQTDIDKLKKYMASVPPGTIEDIYNSYRNDFEMFGFSRP